MVGLIPAIIQDLKIMSDRKYELAYIVSRRNLLDNSSIPCAIFQYKDAEEAQNTVDAYNQKFKDEGLEGFVFELHVSALYD